MEIDKENAFGDDLCGWRKRRVKIFASAQGALGIRLDEGKGTCTGCVSQSCHTVTNGRNTGYAGRMDLSLGNFESIHGVDDN